MSESIPEAADIRQLRTQAKELLRSLQSGETRFDEVSPAAAKLADAQRLIAHKYGFESWPKLVDQVETPILLAKFKAFVEAGDSKALERLLRTKPALRSHLNDPIFSFDAPAVVGISRRSNAAETLRVLVRYGADPNARSTWWAGGFGALDGARGEAAEVLLQLGTKYDVWSAAAHGQMDVLRDLLDKDPELVSAPGGDGETPLHFAENAEVAEFLIERGADLEKKDVDHEGTPIQHQVRNPEVLRVLVRHGATPDIFTAVALDDADLASKILESNPDAANAVVGKDPFVTHQSNGGHIYLYTIGPNMTPLTLAAKLGHRKALEPLLKSQPDSKRLIAAAWLEDSKGVEEIMARHPRVADEIGADSHFVAEAAQQGKTETVRLLLKAGLDPQAEGMDSGTALHVASWFGYIDVVRLLIDRVPLDFRDRNHGSTPLGWATHGAQYCQNDKGDYVAVVEALLEAGADLNVSANSNGDSMLKQAGLREDVKAVLRKHGAK